MIYDRTSAYDHDEEIPKGTPDKKSNIYLLIALTFLLIAIVWEYMSL